MKCEYCLTEYTDVMEAPNRKDCCVFCDLAIKANVNVYVGTTVVNKREPKKVPEWATIQR